MASQPRNPLRIDAIEEDDNAYSVLAHGSWLPRAPRSGSCVSWPGRPARPPSGRRMGCRRLPLTTLVQTEAPAPSRRWPRAVGRHVAPTSAEGILTGSNLSLSAYTTSAADGRRRLLGTPPCARARRGGGVPRKDASQCTARRRCTSLLAWDGHLFTRSTIYLQRTA